MKFLMMAALVLVLGRAAVVQAAEPADFICKGVALGDPETKMLTAFGKPLFDREAVTMGMHMKYYTFPKGYVVGVAVKTGKVLDIVIKDEDYMARDGVKRGATPYRIRQVYGNVERTFLDGEKFYIYANPVHPHQRLLLAADTMDNYLLWQRITELPLTEEEADQMVTEDDWDNPDLEARQLQDRAIDTSRLPQADGAQLKVDE
jgi:hypothetical protein